MIRFIVTGAPRTAKNHQRIVTNRKTGKPFIIAGKSAKGWGADAVNQLATQKPRPDWPAMPGALHVMALVYRDRNVGDLDNFLHSVGDALQKAGVILNDKQIESWDRSRKLIDRERPRVEVYIEPFDEEKTR